MPERSKHWRRAAKSVVRIEHGRSYGTAFLLDPAGFFLTAYHNVADAWTAGSRVRVLRGATVDTTGVVIAVDVSRDLAVLKVDLPPGHQLRPAALAAPSVPPAQGLLVVFHMLDAKVGVVAPIETRTDHLGETVVSYPIGGSPVLVDRVWSRQDLVIIGGTSGAPAVDPGLAAIVAVACAGADVLRQAFFVPIGTAFSRLASSVQISKLLFDAQERVSRLGSHPNGRGLRVLGWLATRSATQSLLDTAVYDPARSIVRATLLSTLEQFLQSNSRLCVLAGVSGVGKSTSIAKIARSQTLSRPIIFLRAAQLELDDGGLRAALAKALSISTIDALPRTNLSAPLLVIDGFNEIRPFARGREVVATEDLTQLVLARALKDWKILVTTRVEALDDFKEMPPQVSLFDPEKHREGEASGRDDRRRVFDRTPHVRLEGYSRAEFEAVRRLYGLPPSLPYEVFRHPIVLRIAVRSMDRDQASVPHVRDLLHQYYASVVRRVHSRLGPGRNLELVARRLDQLTSAGSIDVTGVIPTHLLNLPDDVAVAEAAASEGLLEHVPGGYRYVYDEVFEYIRARTLALEIMPLLERSGQDVVGLVRNLGELRLAPSLIARALELAGDEEPVCIGNLANQLKEQLLSRQYEPFVPNFLTSIFARVERGGALDLAKEALPLLTEKTVDDSTFEALSQSHLSYAFSVEHLCRIIRSSARLNGDHDSFPFRPKDLFSEEGAYAADFALKQSVEFAPLRHLIDIVPHTACDYLLVGLSERRQIGREHSFGDFCAQALAVFFERFDQQKIISKAGIEGVSLDLFERVAYRESDYLLNHFLDESFGFIEARDTAARCLNRLRRLKGVSTQRLSEIAETLILRHGHPVRGFGSLLSDVRSESSRAKLINLIDADWFEGAMNVERLAEFTDRGLVSVGDALAMCRQRLLDRGTNEQDNPHAMMSALSGPLLAIVDDEERSSAIELAVEMVLEQPSDRIYHTAAGTELLLRVCESLSKIPPRLEAFIVRLARDEPRELCNCLKFCLFSHFAQEAGRNVRDQAASLLIHSVRDAEAIFSVMRLGAEREPTSSLLREFVQWFFEYGREEWLYESLRDWAEGPRSEFMKAPLRAVVAFCVQLGHEMFKDLL